MHDLLEMIYLVAIFLTVNSISARVKKIESCLEEKVKDNVGK